MKSLVLAVLLALVTVPGAVAQSTPVSDKPFFEAREDVTTFAHVIAVDRKTRTVTLWTEEEEDTVSVQVSKDVKTLGKVKAGELLGHVAGQLGGKGGGRPDLAQGGANDGPQVVDVLRGVADWVRERLA